MIKLDKQIINGMKFGLGFILVIGLLLGLVWAGTHLASQVIPGTFIGNFIFQGNTTFNGNTIFGNNQSFTEPFIGYNSQNNTYLQIQGSDKDLGIPTLDLRTMRNNTYVGIISWSAEDLSSTEKRLGGIGIIRNGTGNNESYMKFFIRNSTDTYLQEKMRLDKYGNLGIGTTNPTERLDLGGGNIKMGYEQILTAVPSGSAVGWYYATCSAGKYVIGGACATGSGLGTTNTYFSGNNSFGCYKSDFSTNWQIQAICVNIR